MSKVAIKIGIAAFAAALVLTAGHVHSSIVAAQEPRPTPSPADPVAPPPLGDCFGGVFRDDPLHCYILEQSESDDTIDVDAIYLSHGNEETTQLHIFIRQTEPLSTELGQNFKRKATYFMDQWPDLVFTDHDHHEYCVSRRSRSDKDCVLNVNTLWLESDMLPIARSFTDIQMHPGGAEARKSTPGWASYRQVWPAVAASSGSQPSGIDVSGVDTTAIPELDCASPIDKDQGETCSIMWFFDFGGFAMQTELAGWKHSHKMFGNSVSYVQVKAAEGDTEKVRIAREEIGAVYPNLTDDALDNGNLIVIPVRHSFEEYWRWANILSRFAASSGNTIGIVRVEISGNYITRFAESDVTLRAGISGAETNQPENLRTTIRVWTLDARATLDNMSSLLTALDIPDDAVGVIMHMRHEPPDIMYRAVDDDLEIASRGGPVMMGKIVPKPTSCRQKRRANRRSPKQPEDRASDTATLADSQDNRYTKLLLYVAGGSGAVIIVALTAAVIAWRVRRRRKGPEDTAIS